jgi:hypothetical protein
MKNSFGSSFHGHDHGVEGLLPAVVLDLEVGMGRRDRISESLEVIVADIRTRRAE